MKIKFEYKLSKKHISQYIKFYVKEKLFNTKSSIRFELGNLDNQNLHDIWDQLIMQGESPMCSTSLNKEIKIVDLFCGSGGFTEGVKSGLKQLGINARVLAGCDLDEKALSVYNYNHQPEILINNDVNSILKYRIKENNSNIELENVKFKTNDFSIIDVLFNGCDILLAGPPCQGHSNLNNHSRGSDPRNNLYLSVSAFAKKLNPSFIAIENVATVLSDHKNVVKKTELILNSLGYHTEHVKIKGEKIGLPQTRNRHFLIAKKNKTFSSKLVIDSFSKIIDNPRTVNWAFNNIKKFKSNDHIFYMPAEVSSVNKKRMKWLIENDLYDLPNHLRPDCHKEGTTYKAVYGRLFPDAPAGTITGGFMSPGRGRFTHPFEPRALTNFEASILQGFPSNYKFFDKEKTYPGNTHLARIIGDAVSPYMSKLIGINFGINLLMQDKKYFENKAA